MYYLKCKGNEFELYETEQGIDYMSSTKEWVGWREIEYADADYQYETDVELSMLCPPAYRARVVEALRELDELTT